jgi:putative Holliday junction resolvase
MRVLCIDYGDKFIGIAISDPRGYIAMPLTVVMSHEIKKIIDIIYNLKVEKIVIGMPKKLNGDEGDQCIKVEKFKKKLENKIKKIFFDNNKLKYIIMWDERFSTIGAKNNIIDLRLSFTKRKKNIDKQAAAFILQGYLDFVNKTF